MYRLIILIFLFSYITAAAQSELNFKTVEDSSYALYLKQDWNQLKKFGREAIKSKIDYFYLRERIGIAYYEQKKYQLASSHFERAKGFNSGDESNQEYLFYSYAFNNRYDEALHLTKHFSNDLKKKTGTVKPASINLAQLDFTVKVPENTSIATPYYFLGFGLNHRITRGYSLFHSYSFSHQKYAISGPRYTEGIYEQHRYYLSANIPLVKGFILNPAFSVMLDQYIDTLFATPPQPPQRPPRSGVRKRNYASFIGSLNVSKGFPYV